MDLPFADRRRVTLGLIIAGLVPAFAVTHVVIARFKDRRTELAREWTTRGETDLVSRPTAAVADFETALSYSPDDTESRFKLAQALVASSRYAEARAQLLTLWTEHPGDGPINLQLARLAALSSDISETTRYYHAAIDGAWESGATASRRAARIELATFLLNKGQNVRAQAELIATIDDLPADPAITTEIGNLLLEAGAESRALALFQRALTLDRTYQRAAILAGGIAFRAADFRRAHDYFSQAARSGDLDSDTKLLYDVSSRILTMDPNASHLTTSQRATRVIEDLAAARTRLERCTAGADQATGNRIAEFQNRIESFLRDGTRAFTRDPDTIDDAMAVVFEVANLPSTACGEASRSDRALQLLAAQPRPQAK